MQDTNTQDSSDQNKSKRSKKRDVLERFKKHLSSMVEKVNSMVKKNEDKLPK